MAAIFTIKKSTLKNVNAEEGTRLFRGLLWCEARRVGLSPHNIVISLDTTVPDGGIDARVDGSIDKNSIIVKGGTYFQLKAGHSFKPWQLSALKKELFGTANAKPKKQFLATGIQECLEKKGRYVLVTLGYDLTPPQQLTSKTLLKRLFRNCGYRLPDVDVLGQGQIVGQLSLFPSLSLSFQNKDNLSFHTVEEWKSRADMVQPLQLSEEQQRLIKTIRADLRGHKFRHIRLIGEPGLGKTRIALEAVTADDLEPQVLYVPHAEDFQRGQLFNELLRNDTYENIILVIDECSERERASIWNSFREKKNICLLTIDHGPEQSRDEAMTVLELPRLPDDRINAILGSYVPGVHLSHWVGWCEGSPRVAHAVGENLRSNPGDLLRPPATVPIWDRFIAGYEPIDSPVARESLTMLRYLSLFTKFGFEEPVAHEAKFIWQLINTANPAITWARFQELVTRLRDRRILQGKRTLFIVPKALHIHLWIDYWNNYGRDFVFVEFFANVPSQLRHWFLQSFVYGHASPVASDVIARILSPSGPFSDQAFLVGGVGTNFISYLAEADPARTLAFIERTFDKWSKEELVAFKDGRQNIVRTLEKIAVWKEHFARVARLLIKLALAENSKFGNNSTGILRGLFRIYPTGLAATQSSPADRFPMIEELLAAQNDDEIDMGLSLCKEWLSSHGGIRTVGPEYQGLRPTLEFWKPQIWRELFDAWLLCWRHLWSESRKWPRQRRAQANQVLIDAGLDLVKIKQLSDEILESLSKIAEDDATDRRHFTHALISHLKYRRERLPKGVSKRLRELDITLTGKTFWGRFSRFVLNTNWDEDYSVKGDKVRELPNPSFRVKSLVSEVVGEPTLLSLYLPKIVREEGHRLLEFGRLLATKLNQDLVTREIITAQLDAAMSKNFQFIGGYFSGLRSMNSDQWERLVHELLEAERTRSLGITVISYSGRSEPVVRTLLNMFRARAVDASVFNGLRFEARKAGYSPNLVEDVFEGLVSANNERSLRVAIDLAQYYYFDKENPRSCDEQLLFKLITAPYFFRRDRDDHYRYAWFEVAKGVRLRFPYRDIEIFSEILSSENELGIRHSNYPAQLAGMIAHDHPDNTWAIICKILESGDDRSQWLEMWLGDEPNFGDRESVGIITVFKPELVIGWVLDKPSERARMIRRCLPKTLDQNKGGKLTELFVEYFGDGELGEGLLSHFWAGGWSGPESEHRIKQRDKAREWVSKIKSRKVLSWLYRFIDYLNELIAQAEIKEERAL